ncbi:hypothetical protein [Streptomyces dioscori]|nr:hypothetical protein [Streptomyces dioscori]
MPVSIPSAGRGVVGVADDRGLYRRVEKPAGPTLVPDMETT